MKNLAEAHSWRELWPFRSWCCCCQGPLWELLLVYLVGKQQKMIRFVEWDCRSAFEIANNMIHRVGRDVMTVKCGCSMLLDVSGSTAWVLWWCGTTHTLPPRALPPSAPSAWPVLRSPACTSSKSCPCFQTTSELTFCHVAFIDPLQKWRSLWPSLTCSWHFHILFGRLTATVTCAQYGTALLSRWFLHGPARDPPDGRRLFTSSVLRDATNSMP